MQSAAIPSSSVSSEAGASREWDGLAAAAVAGTIRNFSEDL